MSQENSLHNRAVWFDIPVADLDRADAFYAAVLACTVDRVSMPGMSFSVLEHDRGNGGCLVEKPGEVASDRGILVYFNAEGRIRDAVSKAREHGGEVVEDTHSIGPHGFRAIVLDSEGNRIALHSESDA
ncbi:MAG: VOC family protein [Planctomycetes bacterium]|nr:VOC family protein [Planctomycetota bacterium]MCB9919027.1 VOC family protein [Planctomycetota bacterium]